MGIAKRYGPYLIADGYRSYLNIDESGKKSTILEHRMVMESHLGRKLVRGEVVHHRDGNRSNNDIANLELMDSLEHVRQHGAEKSEKSKLHLKCVRCGIDFIRAGNDERYARRVGKVGPFCGKSCSGKWSRQQQINSGRSNLRRKSL